MAKGISIQVIRRLPRYYRFLSELETQGVDKISSTKLADVMNATASQVRQDLNCFGGFGQQGYGYSVSSLKKEIGRILGLDQNRSAALFGAGNLGRAVANHIDFSCVGFRLAAIFEKNPALVGTVIGGITVCSDEEIDAFFAENPVDTAFLALPKEAVEGLIDRLYSLGIRYYWNFSHYDIAKKYADTVVENVHMTDSLMTLCYRINEKIKSSD